MANIGWQAALACVALTVACEAANSDRVVGKVGPEGGQLTSHDGVLTLVVHPGALATAIEIEIEASDAPPASLGTAYRVRPNLSLEVPAEVVYAAAARLDETAAVAAIRQEDYEAYRGHWVTLPRLQLDAAHGVVAGIDGALSPFYGLVDGEAPVDPTGGSTGTDGATGSSSGSTGDGTTTGFGELSHAADIQPIWEQNCLGAGCHSSIEDGGGPLAHVRLDGDAYPNIVDVMPAAATVPYVTPGDPDASYLLHKLEGTHLAPEDEGGCGCNGSGTTMPMSAPLLPEETRAMIRAWIEQGAMP